MSQGTDLSAELNIRSLPSQRSSKRQMQIAYLPTLFDRLLDDEPSQKTEVNSTHAPNRAQMREILRRDLAFVLGTINAQSWLDTARYVQVASSTLNFGTPAMAGGYLSEHKWADIEDMIRQAVLTFEPRIYPESLRVLPLLKDGAHNHYNVLLFELSGLVKMQPYPLEFLLQSAVDLETSRITLS